MVIFLITLVASNKVRLSGLKKEIASTEKELVQYKDLEETVISLEKGLRSIREILEGGSKWGLFFAELEKSTPNDIQFTKLDIKGNKAKADLIGKNVESLSRFVESFKTYKVKDNPLYKNIEVSGFTKEEGTVKFSADFEINTEVLW